MAAAAKPFSSDQKPISTERQRWVLMEKKRNRVCFNIGGKKCVAVWQM